MTLEEAKELSDKYIAIIDDTKDTMSEWHGYNNAEMHQVKRIIQTFLNYIENESIPKEKIKEIICPTPENYIPIEVQTSDMYSKLQELLGE